MHHFYTFSTLIHIYYRSKHNITYLFFNFLLSDSCRFLHDFHRTSYVYGSIYLSLYIIYVTSQWISSFGIIMFIRRRVKIAGKLSTTIKNIELLENPTNMKLIIGFITIWGLVIIQYSLYLSRIPFQPVPSMHFIDFGFNLPTLQL